MAGLLAAGFASLSAGLLGFVRPFGRALVASSVALAAVLGWWLTLKPSNDRTWRPELARLTTVEVEGDLLAVHDLRNFDHRGRGDFEERWEERVYDLSQLVGVDLFLSYWGSPHIAHTIMSWGFADGRQLAISIETRKESHEDYSAVKGFFRQFELYYVVADERDVVKLRTHVYGDDIYLYPLTVPVETARAVLLDYVRAINALAEEPRWYNAATHNCTTMIRHHVRHVGAGDRWDWRLLANGHLDELGYERGTITSDLPLPALRERSRINARAHELDPEADFSRGIREGLPGMRDLPQGSS